MQKLQVQIVIQRLIDASCEIKKNDIKEVHIQLNIGRVFLKIIWKPELALFNKNDFIHADMTLK